MFRTIHGVSKTFFVLILSMAALLSVGCNGSPATTVSATPVLIAEATAIQPTNTSEPLEEVSPSPTKVPTEEPTPEPELPTATIEPSPTPSPEPTLEPSPTPSPTTMPTPVPIPQPNWLSYLNQFRSQANLPILAEDATLTIGSAAHAQYMVRNNEGIAHSEEPGKLHYSEAGDLAARKGNLFSTNQSYAQYNWAVNFWISAPFHLISVINPKLHTVGYGDFSEEAGSVQYAAVMNVLSGKGTLPDTVEYPIYFPKDGGETWIVRHTLFEWPDPHESCPGHKRPSGPALILQLADETPRVTDHSVVLDDGQVLDSCLFDETNYINSNQYTQQHGRTILKESHAIVIMPRSELPMGRTIMVNVVTNNQAYSWSFKTIKPPSLP